MFYHRAAGLQQLQQPVDLENVLRSASSLSNDPIPPSPSPLMFNKIMLDPMEHLPRSPTPGRTMKKEASMPPPQHEGIADTESLAIHNQVQSVSTSWCDTLHAMCIPTHKLTGHSYTVYYKFHI